MSNTLIKSASSWTAAVPGASMPCVSVHGVSTSRGSMPGAYLQALGGRLREWRRADARGLRFEQLIQDDQGRSVSEHLIEDTNVPAPATAHMGATVKGGVSGPSPWRRPV
ncbi:hypothetical protein [Actinomadura sp. BRA 177]|uniref:hypothetical protein n=1 Tax=Actinomadura sp. BRA 177 TaxID=2745202 RepID=UPI0015957570|nr:hypothetical protein [Actinomadura sp. BRA 177]NVI88422.1 hypothetical protein [Actinomadura sp. BRA 177]